MADMLDAAVFELNDLNLNLNENQKEIFYGALRKVRRTEIELRSYKDLLLNTNIDLRSPQLVDWYEISKQFIQDKKSSGNNQLPKVICGDDGELAKKAWKLRSDALELVMMLENFYRNAKEHGASHLQIIFKQDSLEISSDSTPIAESNLNKIFELGFTTKPTGTGIGLNQVSIFLNRFGLKISALNLNNEVCFRINKKER